MSQRVNKVLTSSCSHRTKEVKRLPSLKTPLNVPMSQGYRGSAPATCLTEGSVGVNFDFPKNATAPLSTVIKDIGKFSRK